MTFNLKHIVLVALVLITVLFFTHKMVLSGIVTLFCVITYGVWCLNDNNNNNDNYYNLT